jgi:hypothetical protein
MVSGTQGIGGWVSSRIGLALPGIEAGRRLIQQMKRLAVQLPVGIAPVLSFMICCRLKCIAGDTKQE